MLVRDDKLATYDSGTEDDSTNQRAELLAAIKGFEYLNWQHKDEAVVLVSDSAYLVNCLVDEWYEKWLINGFKNSAGEPVANQSLWIDLLCLLEDRWIAEVETDFVHIRGHNKRVTDDPIHVEWNQMCDELAVKARLSW